MSEPLLLSSVDDRIATVRLNRPPANPIDLDLALAIGDAVEPLASDPAVGAVVLTGTGACFSAGLDLKAVPAYKPDELRRMILTINRFCRIVYAFPKPLVTAVDGHAIGGGLVIALTGDYRIVTANECKLGFAEGRAGIPFPAGPMEIVKAELRPDVARRLALTCRNIGPEEALRCGLFDEIAEPERLLDRAREIARELAALPQAAYSVIKYQLRAAPIARMTEIVAGQSDPLLNTWLSGETQAAASEILEK
jgi:enoyl-CoA hydratase